MRDQFNLSGDFRGAVVNINAAFDRADQSAARPAEAGADLQGLLETLRRELVKVGPGEAEAAEALAVSTATAVETATGTKPNPTLLRTQAQGLLAAGKTLLAASPVIAKTVGDIVDVIQKVADMSGQ